MDKLFQRFSLSTPKTMFSANRSTKSTERPSIQSIVQNFRGLRPKVVTAIQDVECPPIEASGVCAATAIVNKEKDCDIGDFTAMLNEEAEKIRKWKVEAEFELQLLNNKLGNANSTINELRKANSDFQQKIEEQKAQTQEDLVIREDILMKVASNWDICCKMQKQMSSLNDGILRCNKAKEESKRWQQDKLQLVDDLTIKYDNLKMTHVEFADLMKENVAVLEQENYNIQKHLEDTVADYNNLMEDLTDQLEAELEKGMFLKDELKSAQNEISSLKSDIANCNNEVSSKDALILELQEGSKQMGTRFQKLERRNSELSDMVCKKEKKIGNLEREVDELLKIVFDVREVMAKNENLNLNLIKLQEENRTLSFAMDRIQIDLLHERSQLDKEKNTCMKLKNKLEEQMTEMASLKLAIATFEKDAEMSERNRNELIEDMSRREHQLGEISEEKLKLEAELAQYVQWLELARGEKEDILDKTKEANSEHIRIRSELEEKVVELGNQLTDSSNLMEKLHFDADKFLEEFEKMKERDERAVAEICELKAQLSEMEKNKATALNYDSQIAEMMNTLQSYKVDNEKIVTQKQKEIEDLKEIVELGVKHHSELISTHQDEISAIMQQLKAANDDLEIAVNEKNENGKKLEESEKTIVELKKIQQCQEIELAELKALNQSQGTSSFANKKSILKRTVGKAVTFIKTPSPITSDNSNSDGVEIAPNVVEQLFNKSTLTYSVAKLKPICTSSPLKTYENRKLKSNYRLELSQQSLKKAKRDYAVDPEKRTNLRTKSENKSPQTKNIRVGESLGWFEEDITMSDI